MLPARGDVGDERDPLVLAAVLSRSLHDAASVALAVLGMLLLGVESLTGDPLDPVGVGFILVAVAPAGYCGVDDPISPCAYAVASTILSAAMQVSTTPPAAAAPPR